MNLSAIRKIISELGDKLSAAYQERDRILHEDGFLISEYYNHQKAMWKKFYPACDGDHVPKQKPAIDAASELMKPDYDALLNLQMASAPARKKLSELKTATRAYESERNKLILQRQELEKNPQSGFDF